MTSSGQAMSSCGHDTVLKTAFHDHAVPVCNHTGLHLLQYVSSQHVQDLRIVAQSEFKAAHMHVQQSKRTIECNARNV